VGAQESASCPARARSASKIRISDTPRLRARSNRLADTAGADDGDRATLEAQPGRGGAREPRGVGVVANQSPVAHHDGVDRAHRGGLRRKFVEQIDDRFL